MSDRDDDARVVVQAQKGQADAFEKLVVKYEKQIFAFCMRMIGSRDDAADLTQEVFLRAYKSIKSYKPKAKFSTWLYTIARNQCYNFTRDRSTRRKHVMDGQLLGEDEAVDPVVPDAAKSPEHNARMGEYAELIRRALNDLSEEHRAVILLREYQGMSYEEMSKVLGIRTGTIKSRLARARQNMQKALEPLLDG
ncbi:RNA polymerase sigma factor [Candidatus Hydrogenedentota bacterium]